MSSARGRGGVGGFWFPGGGGSKVSGHVRLTTTTRTRHCRLKDEISREHRNHFAGVSVFCDDVYRYQSTDMNLMIYGWFGFFARLVLCLITVFLGVH